MNGDPKPPEKYHADNHLGEFATCWRCGRARAKCRAKRSFTSWQDAERAARQLNEERQFERPVARYPCRWCRNWHLTTCRTKVRVKRAEKARRKWLVKGVIDAG